MWRAVAEEHACIEVKAGRLYCSALVGDPDNFLDETRTWLNDSELRPGIPKLDEHRHSCQQQHAGPFSATCPACRLLIPADTRSKVSVWYVPAALSLFQTVCAKCFVLMADVAACPYAGDKSEQYVVNFEEKSGPDPIGDMLMKVCIALYAPVQ